MKIDAEGMAALRKLIQELRVPDVVGYDPYDVERSWNQDQGRERASDALDSLLSDFEVVS